MAEGDPAHEPDGRAERGAAPLDVREHHAFEDVQQDPVVWKMEGEKNYFKFDVGTQFHCCGLVTIGRH